MDKEKVGKKVGEAEDKAIEAADQTQKKAEEHAHKIEKSRVGKALPTKLENIGIRDIIIFILSIRAFFNIPIHLEISSIISTREGHNKSLAENVETAQKASHGKEKTGAGKKEAQSAEKEAKKGKPERTWYYTVLNWCFTIFGMLAIIFDTLVIILKMEKLFVVSMLSIGIKMIVVTIIEILLPSLPIFSRTLRLLYKIGVICVDLLFLYYGALFFSRIKSSDFDENGDKKEPDV